MEMKKLVKDRLCKRGDSAAAAAGAIVHEVMVVVVVVVVSSAAGELRGAWRFHGFDDEERREPASCALPFPAYLFTAPAPAPKKMSDVLSRIDYHPDSVMTQVPAILCSGSKKTDTTLRERENKKKQPFLAHSHEKWKICMRLSEWQTGPTKRK